MRWKLVWKNLLHDPLSTTLSLLLLTVGVSIITLLLGIKYQVEKKLDGDLKNIDLVIGAKGSPLQLILSSIYHLDAPTGNISLEDAKEIASNPMVETAIPLAYGDNYNGFRILGTDSNWYQLYETKIYDGKMPSENMEVVLGWQVAQKTGLRIGDSFEGTHGNAEQGEVHEGHPYKVVGILTPSYNVADQLIVTNVSSVIEIHEEHEHDHAEEHVHAHEEITAMLLQFRSPMAMMTMPRKINEETNFQAAIPNIEIRRLLKLLDGIFIVIQAIGIIVMLLAGISVFLSLFQKLQRRKYEIALLQSIGYSKWYVRSLLIYEAFLLAIFGYVIGFILSRIILFLLESSIAQQYGLNVFSLGWMEGEYLIFLITLLTGIISAIIPAWYSVRTSISKTLADGK
jgi:putative ABC transport system permease protein